MKKLTAEQFSEYVADPQAFDDALRQLFQLPEDKYYTVATWPKERTGEVRVTAGLHRSVRSPKVSKSDQT